MSLPSTPLARRFGDRGRAFRSRPAQYPSGRTQATDAGAAQAAGATIHSSAVSSPMASAQMWGASFSSCAAHGGKAWDHSGMVRALEMMAGHEVAKA